MLGRLRLVSLLHELENWCYEFAKSAANFALGLRGFPRHPLWAKCGLKLLNLVKSRKNHYVMSPYPTVVMVTTAHQKPSGMDLKWECGEPASAKYTVLENSTTPMWR